MVLIVNKIVFSNGTFAEYKIDTNSCWNVLSRQVQKDGTIVCKIKHNGKQYTSLTRLSYDLFHNKVTSGETKVKRMCGNKRCINPKHLFESNIGDWRKDEIGNRYGKLEVIEYDGDLFEINRYVTCRCDCGTVGNFSIDNIRIRSKTITVSCGCVRNEKTTNLNKSHEKSNTKIYHVLARAKSRCYSSSDAKYKHYGGRGIKVCDEWLNDFNTFYSWSINNGYEEGLSLDRIDVNGDYCAKNCRWITMEEQASNKQNTLWVLFEGELHCLHTLMRKLNRLNNYYTVKRYVFRDGFTLEESLSIKSTLDRNILKFKYFLIENEVQNCSLHIYELGELLKIGKKTSRKYFDILEFQNILKELRIEVYR